MRCVMLVVAAAFLCASSLTCTSQQSEPDGKNPHGRKRIAATTQVGNVVTYNGFPSKNPNEPLWNIDMNYEFKADKIDFFEFNFDTAQLNRWKNAGPADDTKWRADFIWVEDWDRNNFKQSEVLKRESNDEPNKKLETLFKVQESGEYFKFHRDDDPANFDGLCQGFEKHKGKFYLYVAGSGGDHNNVKGGRAIVQVHLKP